MTNEKTQVFYAEVEAIEARNLDVFKDRINTQTSNTPDILRNHFLIIDDNNGSLTIGFKQDSYVPEYIRQEVYSSFRSIALDK